MFDTALFRRMTDENLSGCAFGVLSLQAADEIDSLRRKLADAERDRDNAAWAHGMAGKQIQEHGDEINARDRTISQLTAERDHFRELATALAEGKIGVARVFLDKTLFWPVTSKHGSLDSTVDYTTALAAAEAAIEKLKEQPCK